MKKCYLCNKSLSFIFENVIFFTLFQYSLHAWAYDQSRAFRKAAYRHYIIEEYGYLGKHKRRVCPSCCVWKIREHYPSSTGVYMGFKPR